MNHSNLKVVYANTHENIKYYPRELALASHEYIAKDVMDIKTSYIRLGFHLCECRERLYYRDFGFDSLADYADANFGLDRGALSRCMNVFMRFSLCQGGIRKMFLNDRYKDYSYSQLCEMVSMEDKQLNKIKPSMTVKEIRELKQQARKKDEPGTVKSEQAIQEGKVATSQLSDPDPEPELQEKEPDHVQPDLPALKNNDQRKDWLRSYKDWGLWYRDDHINVDYYKYDFDNGARLIVEMYHRKATKYRDAHDEYYYHLLHRPDSEFERFPDSETVLLEFLKDLQKKKNK